MITSGRSKLIFRISILAVALAVVAFLFFNEYGIMKYLKLKGEISDIEKQISDADNQLRALQAEIDSLKTSNVKIEKVAREKYNMLRKNEKVLKVEEN